MTVKDRRPSRIKTPSVARRLLLTAGVALCSLLAASSASAATYVPPIRTIVGNGLGAGYSGDGKSATNARINDPQGVAVNSAGDVYIADAANNAIRMVPASSGTHYGQQMTAGNIYTIVGHGTQSYSPGAPAGYTGDGGPAANAELDHPTGVTVGPDGSLYIVDMGNYAIRMVPASSGAHFGQLMAAGDIYTIAGDGTEGSTAENGGLATSAEIGDTETVAVSPLDGSLNIADVSCSCIWKVSAKDDSVSSFGPALYGGVPLGVGFDTAGNLYVAAVALNEVWKISPDGAATIIAGTGTQGYSGDGGPATSAELYYPHGLAVGPDGRVYFSDRGNNRIRVISPNGIISTYAGDGTAGFSGDRGPATAAETNYVESIAVGANGDLYLTDSLNNRVREAGPEITITTSPASALRTSSATLSGAVNPGGLDTTYYFQYGHSSSYGQSTSQGDAGAGARPVAVNASVGALTPNSTYHFRLVATNANATSYGPDTTLRTVAFPTAPPTVTITGAPPASSTTTSATVTYVEAGPVSATVCALGRTRVSCNSTRAQLTGLRAGKHTFTVAVSGPGGADNRRVQFTSVPIGKRPPVAHARSQRTGALAATTRYQLNGSAHRDPDGTIVSWRWYDNGRLVGHKAVISQRLHAGADYHFRLTVRDSHGLSASTTITVKVPAVHTNEH